MKKNDKKTKALVLLSGGLDSMLAVRILQAQGIEVEALAYRSNFYSTEKAEAAAEFLGVKLHIVDISQAMLELVKNPPSGYGKNLNPCIDCHGMMFAIPLQEGVDRRSLAGEVAPLGFEPEVLKVINDATSPLPPSPSALLGTGRRGIIIASGEVLGQRPFSQNRRALERVQKLAGREILRPLSAKLLPETEYEKSGLVDHSKLFDIQGRTRERQKQLAEKFGIKDYPSPAGGCLLTDPDFSKRLKEMLEFWPDCSPSDVELLKHGRVFWLKFPSRGGVPRRGGEGDRDKVKRIICLIGRNEAENAKLEGLAQKGDFVVKLRYEVGPSTLVRIRNNELGIMNQESGIINNESRILVPKDFLEIDISKEYENIGDLIEVVGKMTAYYAPKLRGREVEVEISNSSCT